MAHSDYLYDPTTLGSSQNDDCQHRPFSEAFPLRLKSMAYQDPRWKHEWHASGQCEEAVNVYLNRSRDLDSLFLSRVQITPFCLGRLAAHFWRLQKLEIEFCHSIRIPLEPWRVDSGFFQYDPSGRLQFFASSSEMTMPMATGLVGSGDLTATAAVFEVLPKIPPRCCILNDEMAVALSSFYGLRSLVLTQSNADDSKVSHYGFFRLLEGLPHLECLSLSGMDIGDDPSWEEAAGTTAAAALMTPGEWTSSSGLVAYPQLKCVRLVATHMNPSVASIFYAALPNLLTYDTSLVDEATSSDMVLLTMMDYGCTENLLSVRLALDDAEGKAAQSTILSEFNLCLRVVNDDDLGETDYAVEEEEDLNEEESVHWTVLSNPALEAFLVSIPRIECLDLEFVPLFDHSLALIAISCTRLKTLRVAQCPKVTERGVSHIVRLCHRLAYLRLEGLPRLQILFEHSLFLGQAEYEPWACATQLQHLAVVDCPLWDQHWTCPDMIQLIRRRLSDLLNLAVLELVGCMNAPPPHTGNGSMVGPYADFLLLHPKDFLPRPMPSLWRLNWQLGGKFLMNVCDVEHLVRVQCPGLRRLRMIPLSNWEELYWCLRRETEPVELER
ncbi:hypothetical protein BGX23_010085 [Mortierella sp. AD031]|nr:hypothetical protein BGX23_010085 [Mortierella sp. AD031]